jgi:hypothetical protein
VSQVNHRCPRCQLIFASRETEKARALIGADCCTPGRAATYLGWSGSVHSFDFRSERFAVLFLDRNATKALNVAPRLRAAAAELHEQQRRPPTAALPPASSSTEAPGPAPRDGDLFLRWVSKIETAKGPASRRAALEAATRQIQNPDDKARLFQEATRIEVDAALTKADSLKTVAAKRRVLQEALEYVRSDNVPDTFQTDEIKKLEAALAQLDAEHA